MKSKNFLTDISVLLFVLLFIIPILIVLSKGITSIGSVISSSYYRKIICFSVYQAGLSAIISALVGLPGAYFIANCRFKLKSLVRSVLGITFVLPSVLAVLGFVIFYGNNGLLNTILGTKLKILYSFKAIILAHVYFNAPLFISLVSRAWENIDSSCIETARTEGADEFQIFTKITLPSLFTSICSAVLMIFLFCFTSFSIILVLGKGPTNTTTEVEIYRLARTTMDLNKACGLSLISVATAFLIILANSLITKKNSNFTYQTQLTDIKKRKLPLSGHIYLTVICIFVSAPVLSIVFRSFFASQTRTSSLVFSLNAYKNLDWSCILRTILIALSSSTLAVTIALGLCCFLKKRKSSIMQSLLMLPMAVSSVITGFSYYLVYKILKFIPSYILIILMHSMIILPFSLKSIIEVYFNLPEDCLEAAKIEGAGEFTIKRKIVVPQIRGTLLTSFMFSFTLSCGELNSTLTFSNGNMVTIPVQIYRMINSYNWQGACAIGTVLCLITFIIFEISSSEKVSINRKSAF